MNIELTKEEANALLQLIDIAAAWQCNNKLYAHGGSCGETSPNV